MMPDWCYQSQHTCATPCNGPEKWDHANKDCEGRAQSPINIVHRKTLPDERLTPFQFRKYQDSFIQVNVPHQPYVIGGDLELPYKVVQFHLHWGKNGGPGALQRITTTGANTTLASVSLEQLIPPQQNLTNYYRYKGSLTTPGCTESVIWTLRVFSDLQFKDGKPMVGTFRPVQPLNGRVVYRSGDAMVLASTVILMASVTMAMGLSQPN
ncbi:unnamed protein product [Coregonus sp. 'balchen']|nr:unnamed protein product [Coregonus sp. 'balchen']